MDKLGGKVWTEGEGKMDYSIMTKEKGLKEIDQGIQGDKRVTFSWLFDCFFNLQKMNESDYEIKA